MTGFMMRAFHTRAIVITLLSLSVLLCNGEQIDDLNTYFSQLLADLWLEGADVVRIIWKDCSKKLMDVKDVIDHKQYFPKFVRCMKRKTLRALDRALGTDVVPIAYGVNLVRYELVDRSGNVVLENQTSWTDQDLERGDWRTLALRRIGKVLRTHVIKFDLDGQKTVDKVAYRGRRRYHMMTMMMFGIVSIGMVLVPMGFQFLAVLGGKALLLAKMALILASIQGLKKIATNPINYGFYHSYPPPPPPPPLPFEHFEKRSRNILDSPLFVDTYPSTTTSKNNSPDLYTGDKNIDRVLFATDVKEREETTGMDDDLSTTILKNNWPKLDTGDKKIDRILVTSNIKKREEITGMDTDPSILKNNWPNLDSNDKKVDHNLVASDVKEKRQEITAHDIKTDSEYSEARYYPIYPRIQPAFPSLDAPTVADMTTTPGEVQADVALDMPYNGFRFRTPAAVVSA